MFVCNCDEWSRWIFSSSFIFPKLSYLFFKFLVSNISPFFFTIVIFISLNTLQWISLYFSVFFFYFLFVFTISNVLPVIEGSFFVFVSRPSIYYFIGTKILFTFFHVSSKFSLVFVTQISSKLTLFCPPFSLQRYLDEKRYRDSFYVKFKKEQNWLYLTIITGSEPINEVFEPKKYFVKFL